MRWRQLNANAPITYALVFATGDEVVGPFHDFVRSQSIDAGSVTAIGAFERATLGYFDWTTKQYRKIPVNEQVEVLSLLGDVAAAPESGPSLHLHAVLGKGDGSVVGGHLLEAHVRPTLEVILTRPPSHLHKRKDAESGLALIAVEES